MFGCAHIGDSHCLGLVSSCGGCRGTIGNATTAARCSRLRYRLGSRRRRLDCRCTTTAACRRGGRRGSPSSLLSLPPRPDPGDLVVRKRCHMAAHRDIHLSKEVYHLIDGDPEFACHVIHEKLAQNTTSLNPHGSTVEPPAFQLLLRRNPEPGSLS